MTALNEFAQPPMELTFDLLVKAWKKLRKERMDDLRRSAPSLTSLDKVFIRKVAEDEDTITVEFAGLDTAALDQSRSAEVRRIIEIWLQRISENVRKVRNTSTVLTLNLSKRLRIGHIDMTKFARGKMNATPKTESKYEHKDPRGLTRIIVERGI